MPAPLTHVRQISHLAYGFFASKALFAALNLELFGHISAGATGIDQLAQKTGIPAHRLETLTAALVASGVLVRDGDTLTNAPATERYLVPGAKAYFGDYYRYQIGGQFYRNMLDLDAGLAGDRDALMNQSYGDFLADEEEARAFSLSQHAGSMGPALMLADRLDLSGARRLLDVAGGTGAYAIAFCDRNPDLHATIVDFPAVIKTAQGFIDEAGLSDRIALRGGDAREADWPADNDVVLMSYLLSAVDGRDIDGLLAKGFEALKPGGRLIVHDFMLDEARDGPSSAALFFLSYLTFQPDAISFSAEELAPRVDAAGFVDAEVDVMIPDITKMLIARRPD